jgi:hypothetical protein
MDDRNDHIFKQTITLQIRNEWRREIKINNIIDIINFSVQFGGSTPEQPIATNLTINIQETLTQMLANL